MNLIKLLFDFKSLKLKNKFTSFKIVKKSAMKMYYNNVTFINKIYDILKT